MKLLLTITALILSTNANAACEESEFVRSTDSQVTISITGRGYSPRCLKVSPGTQVTIQASARHPLQGIEGAPANPFVRGSAGSEPDTQTLNAPGAYGYFCTAHGDNRGNGMAGIVVVE